MHSRLYVTRRDIGHLRPAKHTSLDKPFDASQEHTQCLIAGQNLSVLFTSVLHRALVRHYTTTRAFNPHPELVHYTEL